LIRTWSGPLTSIGPSTTLVMGPDLTRTSFILTN
jgi:hypothetical protein